MADYSSFSRPRIENNTDGDDGVRPASNSFNSSAYFEEDVRAVMKELGDLLIAKHYDYGPKNISQSPGGAINGLRVRMWDKLARINNLFDNNRVAKNEPLEDSFKDLANYGVIGLLVLRGKWDTGGK
jgi:hypothetical protein